MDSDTSDNFEDLYEEADASKHDKLVEKVLRLNKTQQLKKPSRTEPTLHVSEFDLVKSITGENGSIQINELTQSLKNRKSRVKISENVKKLQKHSRTLPKPLERPQADRIRRSAAYEKARLELDRWEAVVTSNRVSTDLSFPLDKDTKLDKKESLDVSQMWRVKSELEKELEKIDGPEVEEYSIELEQEKFPLSMKEMLARRREAAKLRAFQGYKEAKARRQSKIKSKKFHRIQKRERIKQQLKEFEELQKTDPEQALKKLEEIEKTRAEERFSLRHKSTGKWARSKQIRAKYDKESRQVLAQQLTLSRELTQKRKSNDSESEEEAEVEDLPVTAETDGNNPWINGIKPSSEVSEFVSNYRKYWTEKNKETINENVEESHESTTETNASNNSTEEVVNKKQNKDEVKKADTKQNVKGAKKSTAKKKTTKIDLDKSKSTSDWDVSIVDNIDEMFDKLENKLQNKMMKNVKKLQTELKTRPKKKPKPEKKQGKKIDLSLPLQAKKPTIDEELIENSNTKNEEEPNKDLTTLQKLLDTEINNKREKTVTNIDPNKFMNGKTTNLSTAIPDVATTDENEEQNQRQIIAEAFEDDDIVQDFNKEKRDEIHSDKPKNIDLSLPGWGSWGGSGIKTSKRKKRIFTTKVPQKMPRRDDNKGSLIINESAQKKIKEHMVSEVPFPFKTVKDFEASMRAPISNTFVPETAYMKLIKPAITTKMGAIIEPLSKDILLNNKNG